MAKEEIAHHEQFLLMPQYVKESSAAAALKCVYIWESVNSDCWTPVQPV